MNRIIVSSFILAFMFLFSWFATIANSKFSSPLSDFLGIPRSTVLMYTIVPALITFSQTHYVYFFVNSTNRRAF
ncbi:hypothetical protein PENTCL1PPCAC_17098, partial [Pristionchus entomophagus]